MRLSKNLAHVLGLETDATPDQVLEAVEKCAERHEQGYLCHLCGLRVECDPLKKYAEDLKAEGADESEDS